MNCCFCGKKIDEKFSHDSRPIVSTNGTRCCSECNANIVIPTRLKVWTSENECQAKIRLLEIKATNEMKRHQAVMRSAGETIQKLRERIEELEKK